MLEDAEVGPNETRLRLRILENDFKGAVAEVGDHRNPDYWEVRGGSFVVKPGKLPTDAIKNIWDYFYCLKPRSGV